MNKKGFISMTLVYTFLILFLFLSLSVLTALSQKTKFLDAIKDQINTDVKVSTGTCNYSSVTRITLMAAILRDNTAFSDGEASTYVTSTSGTNFAEISSNSNGRGLYYTSNRSRTEDVTGDGNGEIVYYYRGAVTNNNVIFAGFCWKIVRTNEDGSIKLRYNGTPTNSTCSAVDSSIGTAQFSTIGTAIKHAGYTYTESSSELDSAIKKVIEVWYGSNIANQSSSVTSAIVDVPYCNDLSNPQTATTGTNYVNYTFYGAANRLVNYTSSVLTPKTGAAPQFKCNNAAHKYTVNNTAGNQKLYYPVGLLTADEITYAGATINKTNTTYYLYTGTSFWTMSPMYLNEYGASVFRVYSDGLLSENQSINANNVYPVISIKSSLIVTSGTGTTSSPYIIYN